MRILIHDRPGYPFSVQLSRELAGRGHHVLHLFDNYFQSPKGALTKKHTDSDTFQVAGINIDQPFQKYSFIKRRFQEIAYGKLVAEKIETFRPGVLMSANTPPDAQLIIFKKCRALNIKFISWVHDIHGLAVGEILGKKWPVVGNLIGKYYLGMERRLIKQSDSVVLITDDFADLMNQWGILNSKIDIIPNWAPIEQIPVRPRKNAWAVKNQVAGRFCLLYAGTLGLKHNPELLLQLALHFREDEGVRILVASEGLGADWLKAKKEAFGLDNLSLIGFQSMEQFPNMLASGDVLVALLTPEASVFSVPSKVLSYLCAQRPILLAVPADNLAARIVSQNQAGLVVQASDIDAFVQAAKTLRHNRSQNQVYARNGLAYARKHFNITMIADQFERIISK